jgi:hypothetical protein
MVVNLLSPGKQVIIEKLKHFSSLLIEKMARILSIKLDHSNINLAAIDSQENMLEVEFDIV